MAMVFAVMPEGQGDDVPIVFMGIPKGAWRQMQNGHSQTFDLTSANIPVKLVVYGAADHRAAMRIIEDAAKAKGVALLDQRRKDFSIKPKTPTEAA